MASLGYVTMPPRQVIASLADIGYEAVGWTLAHFNPHVHTADTLRELVEQTHERQLDIGEIVVQQDYVTTDKALREERLNLSLACIETAGDLGIEVLNFFTGPAPWDKNAPVIGRDLAEGEAWNITLDAFTRIVEVAEKHQVRIAVEGVWGMLCHDYYTTRLLIDHFNSPWLGVNFDPSHDILAGNFDIPWIVRQWGRERIHHIHLKDAVGTQVDGMFLFPMLGEGRVPWADFFEALDAIGYAGCCSVEFESFAYHNQVLKGDTSKAARLSFEQVHSLLP